MIGKNQISFNLTGPEEEKLVAFKRDLHMFPELSHQEVRTTQKIRDFLRTIEGVELLELKGVRTGVVARIRGLKPSALPGGSLLPDGAAADRTSSDHTPADNSSIDRKGPETVISEVGLRADIDAIRQEERYESPWKSTAEGVMHACGHDFHTASLLGAAVLLSKCRDEWGGTVDLLFQEAEETTDGAKEMIDAGLLELIHPQLFFGSHNRPEVEAGKVVCHRGALMAAKTNFHITVRGTGGHGGNPHLCADPIVCSAAMIQSLQTVVSRNTDPLNSVIMTVGSIHGGIIENLIPDEVTMTASIRALQPEAKEKAVLRAEEIIYATARAYDCEAEITYREILPPIFNTDDMYDLAREAAVSAVGESNVVDALPTMASEDFSLIMERVPSFFYWFGSGTPGEVPQAWHSDTFHTDDSAIRTAALTMAQAAVCALGLPAENFS